jgi:hypothetical protein
MDIKSAFNAGVEGFQRASFQANQAANNIAQQTRPIPEQVESVSQEQQEPTKAAKSESTEVPLTTSVVDLKVSEFQAKASANVIQSADEALGTLIDVKV